MESKIFVYALLGMVLLVAGGSIVFAQEEEEQGHVFTISTFKVSFGKLDEYLELWDKESTPLIKKNEFILSHRVFTHSYGPDWNIVVITEYENLSAIESANKKSKELFKEKYPDEDKLDEIYKQFGSYILAHTDAIVRERPKLRK